MLVEAFKSCETKLLKVVSAFAHESINAAAFEIRELNVQEEVVTSCLISCDGPWQHRSHTSLNGCAVALCIDTAEVVDVEIISKNY
ncbi:hypothetical protein TNIN_359541 [Trichonephila inaurata madagascariensis]|uniref:Mutator-like transposase domain-containing protein n=1 Tax=Trichonephila inaurata madagascariensis TaxID=2747483 RepID=A0A8X6WSN5_9ARAC|nr:hypothetical protein TNIN_359541 [Trichonephila inaurata madagascariensis]